MVERSWLSIAVWHASYTVTSRNQLTQALLASASASLPQARLIVRLCEQGRSCLLPAAAARRVCIDTGPAGNNVGPTGASGRGSCRWQEHHPSRLGLWRAGSAQRRQGLGRPWHWHEPPAHWHSGSRHPQTEQSPSLVSHTTPAHPSQLELPFHHKPTVTNLASRRHRRRVDSMTAAHHRCACARALGSLPPTPPRDALREQGARGCIGARATESSFPFFPFDPPPSPASPASQIYS